jgi:UDP-glucose 4-epimerase
MKILVIGSKGFIGSHLCSYLRSQSENEIWECDVMVDYGNDCYFQIDSTNADYHSIFERHTFSHCINCSGAASVPDSLVNPVRDFTLNTYNVVKVLDAIRQYSPGCKFINLSSAAVYGNPETLPIPESLTLSPISPYGIHKLQAEQICLSYYNFFNIRTCSLRIFSAFGRGLKKQLFWDIYQKVKKVSNLELFGTGQETRDFIHVLDVCRAIALCMVHAPFEGEAINIGNGEAVEIQDAVGLLIRNFPTTKTVNFNHQVKKGDPLFWTADVTLLKSMGYKQEVSLAEGLKDYYLWVSTL